MSNPPEILTIEETERLLNAIKYPQGPYSLTPKNFRNYLMALFMLDTGLRVSEVIQLKRNILYTQGQFVSALSVPAEIAKLHRSRIIPLSDRLRKEIGILVKQYWIFSPESSAFYVFPGPKHHSHITARRVQQIICTAGMNTLGRRVWPHILRHTFATRLMRVTNTRVVQELLGHKNLTSTQVYTHPNSQDLLKAITDM